MRAEVSLVSKCPTGCCCAGFPQLPVTRACIIIPFIRHLLTAFTVTNKTQNQHNVNYRALYYTMWFFFRSYKSDHVNRKIIRQIWSQMDMVRDMFYSVWQVRWFWPITNKARKADRNTVQLKRGILRTLQYRLISCICELKVLNRHKNWCILHNWVQISEKEEKLCKICNRKISLDNTILFSILCLWNSDG